jgi:ParB family chromosome partitioning protein
MSSKNNQPFRQLKKGSGLDILFGDTSESEEKLDIDSIKLPSQQPRRYFDPQKMEQLVKSIKDHGIIEPLLVRPLDGMYELVAGERRYRAALELKLRKVPVVIRELTDEEALQLALIENLHREDLNPVEETEGILQLIAIKLKETPEKVIKILRRMQNEMEGKVTHNVMRNFESEVIEEVFSGLGLMTWESFVKNRLPLLNLPEKIKAELQAGKIAYTKAKAIASIKDTKKQEEILEQAIKEGLSLSEIKEKIKALNPNTETPPLKTRMSQVYRRLQKAPVWTNPKKANRLEKLIKEIEKILEEEN